MMMMMMIIITIIIIIIIIVDLCGAIESETHRFSIRGCPEEMGLQLTLANYYERIFRIYLIFPCLQFATTLQL